MATIATLKGSPKAFQAVSKATVNAIVDRKMLEASTKSKAMPAVPAEKKAAGARGAEAATKVKVASTPPHVANQAMDAVGNKGGRVDRKA